MHLRPSSNSYAQSVADHHTMDARRVPAAREQWRKFLTRSLNKRVDPDEFEVFAHIHQARWPLPSMMIADLLLRPTPRNSYSPDMLIPQYIQRLLKRKMITVTSVLCALYRHSTLHTHVNKESGLGQADKGEEGDEETKKPPPKPQRWHSSYSVEEIIFFGLTKAVRQERAIKSVRDALEIVRIISSWTTLLSDALENLAATDAMGVPVHSNNLKMEAGASTSAFVLLLLGACEDPVVLSALSRPAAKEVRRQLSEGLAKFVPYMPHQAGDIQARLQIFQTQTLAGFEPVDKVKQKEADDANTQLNEVFDQTLGLENYQVPEIPVENTRAGLYVYLNAALVGRPLIDDAALFSYFHNRYQGDLQATAVHLILASFDVLANAVFRNEGPQSSHLLRSYLINKVPLLLASLASQASAMSVYPFNSELCIMQALNQVDTNVFPTLSNMFDQSSSHHRDTESVRQEFFFACLLHGLVSDSARDKLLGDITFQELPRGGRYMKEVLVQQCMNNAERMRELIGEIEAFEGNAGAVCQAVAEVLVQLCQNKDTMSLKQWCSQLARKPRSLDVLMLFNRPEMILQPLCELLDDWQYDENREDQGEYQLVYEEFSSILFLLLALAYRYGLSAADLKIRSADSFVGKLLSKPHHARYLDDLNEQESSRVGGWIHGLFDSEVSGLGDELMSSCSPQDFYLLIPTLFGQIVQALSTGSLSEDMLKSGLEYLVEPFLLPSLIPALFYLCNHLWKDQRSEQGAVIRVLQLIILPSSISNEEASGMLSSVLNIVTIPLESALRSYLKRDPSNQDIDPLLRALREKTPLSRRTEGADNNELQTWSNGTLAQSVRNITHNLITWAQQQNNTINPNNTGIPTSYTHRQVLMAVKLCGARDILSIVLDEVKTQTEAGNGGVAYDVATALVCAPDVGNADIARDGILLDAAGQVPAQPQRRMSLRDALKMTAERWKKLDVDLAQIVVRLYRRVEAQCVVQQVQVQIPQDNSMDMVGQTAGIMGQADSLAGMVDQNGNMMDQSGGMMGMQGDLLTAGMGGTMDVNVNAADMNVAMVANTVGLDGTVDLTGGQGTGGGGDVGAAGAAGAAGMNDMNSEDIFSGLGDVPGGYDYSDWADSMDLG